MSNFQIIYENVKNSKNSLYIKLEKRYNVRSNVRFNATLCKQIQIISYFGRRNGHEENGDYEEVR